MTRQIALGAIIAFAVTVLALSIWEPKSEPAPPPAPAANAPAMVPAMPKANLKLRPELLRNGELQISPRAAAVNAAVDAGIP